MFNKSSISVLILIDLFCLNFTCEWFIVPRLDVSILKSLFTKENPPNAVSHFPALSGISRIITHCDINTSV